VFYARFRHLQGTQDIYSCFNPTVTRDPELIQCPYGLHFRNDVPSLVPLFLPADVLRPEPGCGLKAEFSRYNVRSLPVNYGKSVSQQLGLKGVNIDADSSGLSIFSIPGLTTIGDASYIPILTTDNLFQEIAGFTYIRGAHSIKFGADLPRRQTDAFQSPTARGQFSFNSNFTNDHSGAVAGSGNAVASFLLGYPASTTRSKYLVYPGLRNWEAAGYLQDDWRAVHRLTLNLGLRYDYYGPNSKVANRISNVDLCKGRSLLPARTAYRPRPVSGRTGRTSRRGLTLPRHSGTGLYCAVDLGELSRSASAYKTRQFRQFGHATRDS
jgi:outer membrane receptor protein involved in Fe transport